MRLYLAPIIGTGYSHEVELDPADYYNEWNDETQDNTGPLITTRWQQNAIRPDADMVHPSDGANAVGTIPLPPGINRKVVFDSGDMAVDGTPVGCENVCGGNDAAAHHPEALVVMNSPLSNVRKNQLEDFVDVPRHSFRTAETNWTPRRLMRWAVGPGWKSTVGGVALGSDEPT